MTYQQLYQDTIAKLAHWGCESAGFEALLFFEDGLGIDRTGLLKRGEEEPSRREIATLQQMLTRRKKGEPIQYILGSWEFYGLKFYVGEGVLIPRPDTETLIDCARELITSPTARFCDLCSGSGCLAAVLAHLYPQAEVTAVEISDVAFGYLKRNLALHGCGDRVRAIKGDVLQEVLPKEEQFDLILCNPPYIRSGELAGLQREVQAEPRLALDGGEDGLVFYREIARRYRSRLAPGGWLLFEAGYDQAPDIIRIFQQNGYGEIGIRRDLAGIERCVFARRC